MPADEQHSFEALFSSNGLVITFEDWLRMGISFGYCSEPVCDTHDGVPMSPEETTAFEDGYDPCIPVVRLKNVEP